MRLDLFSNPEFSRGASWLIELSWIVVSGILVESWLPGSGWRRVLLRIFGATVGKRVVIKPRVRVKFPWRLTIGDHSWIGEQVWIDNLDEVTIGSHCCISQGVYFCTGSHDWTDPKFKLLVDSISIGEKCWVGAMAVLSPGTQIESGTVLAMRSVASGRLAAWSVYRGDPAKSEKSRQLHTE